MNTRTLLLLLALLPAIASATVSTIETNGCYGQYCECWLEPTSPSTGDGASFGCANPNYVAPATVTFDPPRTPAAPEIDPAGELTALTLLLGGLAIFRGRRQKTTA